MLNKNSMRPLAQPKLRQRPASSKPPQLPPNARPRIDWEKEYGASIKRKTKEQKDAIFSILDDQIGQNKSNQSQEEDSDEEEMFGNKDIKDDTDILQFGDTSPEEQTSDEEILFEQIQHEKML